MKQASEIKQELTKSVYELSDVEVAAIQEALVNTKRGDVFEHEVVINEAKERYPNLRFR